MKTHTKDLFLLPAFVVGLALLPPGRSTAQTFTNLHSFSASEGSLPYGRLLLSSNILYGALSFGGSSGSGTVFKINPDGTGFTNLHSFAATSGSSGVSGTGTNSEGSLPNGSLILSGTTLYGAAFEGGSAGNGTIFAIHTDGAGFTNLHNFTALAGSAGDSNVSPASVVVNGLNTVTNLISGLKAFYRLSQ